VRRRSAISKPLLVIGSALTLLLVVSIALSVRRYRAPEAAPPEALAHIAEKNRDAAMIAAAHQRAEAAASSNAADTLVAAQSRGPAAANAALARLSNEDNGTGDAGRRD
jgi:hypothetical protein